jgi:tetratricopeptide (TPR) repeat protein
MREMLDYQKWLIERLTDYEEAYTFYVVATRTFETDGDIDAFKTALDNIIEAQGKDSKLATVVYFARATLYFYLKQYDDAIRDYSTVLEMDPNDKMASFGRNLAESYNNEGENPQSSLSQCLKPIPDNVNTEGLSNLPLV